MLCWINFIYRMYFHSNCYFLIGEAAATVAQPTVEAVVVDFTKSHDIRSLGQKEDIFGDENPEQEPEKKQETKQLVGKFTAAAADNDDDDKLNAPVAEQAISREPVAHAIVQPANRGQGPHDSIADIYLTGAVRNDKSSLRLLYNFHIVKLCIFN